MKNYEALKDDPKRTGESRLTAFPVFFYVPFGENKRENANVTVA